PIVTRILWLNGLEDRNENAYRRYIYIHGTPEERNIGRPASYGCIRMKSRDIVQLFNQVGIGAKVYVSEDPLPRGRRSGVDPSVTVEPLAVAQPIATPLQQLGERPTLANHPHLIDHGAPESGYDLLIAEGFDPALLDAPLPELPLD
ncbi:MAG: L,D-transpeptidase, partial [Verrucomicrobiota bacterium]